MFLAIGMIAATTMTTYTVPGVDICSKLNVFLSNESFTFLESLGFMCKPVKIVHASVVSLEPETMQVPSEVLLVRIIPDKMGTFKGLLRDLSLNRAHRWNLTEDLVLNHEAVNLTQFLEKVKYCFVTIRLSKHNLQRTTCQVPLMYLRNRINSVRNERRNPYLRDLANNIVEYLEGLCRTSGTMRVGSEVMQFHEAEEMREKGKTGRYEQYSPSRFCQSHHQPQQNLSARKLRL
ncbi:uncharacterized protein EDB91DRAFT_1084039 [Suillus paluster]|uniref:uncharacterized protein n=1 Tax=Suillus paluster TaxID=48578 RepID=UPI001B86A4DC|nr:uncharacterized protein EDB91DRAFT_1084039 [Suillus paluster]KAG1734374.1 hypothetical protein EDB91DRAFT_1084039 [Suillus paluster]